MEKAGECNAGHLLHLLGHTTVDPLLQVILIPRAEGGLYKEATNKVSFTTLA